MTCPCTNDNFKNVSLDTLIIVQARMGSTRLPGKVMKQILDRPLLAFLIERLKRVRHAGQVVVATTTSPADLPIVEWCRDHEVDCTRGSEEDVLDRYLQTARKCQARTIVRITADCPLVDPEVIDKVISFYESHAGEYDYVTNCLTRTYPRGMDTEVFSMAALEQAHREGRAPSDREHVTIYLYHHEDRFRLANVTDVKDRSCYRLTVDTPEDFELIRRLLENLYPSHPAFGLEDMVRVLEAHPDWAALNANVKQKAVPPA